MSGVTLRWPVAILAGVALLGTGALVGGVVLRQGGPPPSAASPLAAVTSPPAAGGSEVAITLTDAVLKRTPISTATVTTGIASTMSVPATVQANGYHQVTVMPLVAARITDVQVQLGDRVSKGAPLARLQSPTLAEAETQYVATAADLVAAERDFERLTGLLARGIVSQKQVDRAHADHIRHSAELEAARSHLRLLGLSEDRIDRLAAAPDVDSTVILTAPEAGVVTMRAANPGLTVEPTTALFTIADLSSVWVVGSVYESDYSRVRVGTPVAIRSGDGFAWRGTISYVDPQLNTETRTAQIRADVPNPGDRLRLGLLVDMKLNPTEGGPSVLVPATAIQTIDDRAFVYLPDPSLRGRFIEREVHVGREVSGLVPVVDGLKAGETVVTEGSFFLRAERVRLGVKH